MVRTHLRLLTAALLLSALAADTANAEPPDPLPDGAVARMGSPRLRHVGLAEFAFLADGKTVRTVGGDRVVRDWDLATGRQTRAGALEGAATGNFAMTADGKTVAVANADTIMVWDAESGRALAKLPGPKQNVGSFEFSPDGKMLCASTWDVKFTVWDWRAGTSRQVPIPPREFGMDSTFHGHFSPDGKHFAGGGGSGQPLVLLDTTTWAEKHRFLCDAATSTFTPDGKRLVVSSMKNDGGGRETVIRVFDVATGREVSKFPLGHDSSYFSMAVSPDGLVLGCGASDRSGLVDLTTGKVLHRLPRGPLMVGFSPDSKTFAATAAGTRLRLWDVATGKERHEQPGNFGSGAVTAASPDGRLSAAADWTDQAVHLWDMATGRRVGRFPVARESALARDLTFSPDGKTLAAGTYEGLAQIWDVATGKELRVFSLAGAADVGGRPSVYYHASRVSPDRKRVATLERAFEQGERMRLTVWDAGLGQPVRSQTFQGDLRKWAWSADGDTLALSLPDRVALIDLDTAEERARLDEAVPGTPIEFSPDGRLVAVRRAGGGAPAEHIRVYEVATGRPVVTVRTGEFSHFALGADNRTLVTANSSHLRAWDLATGKELASRSLPETLAAPRLQVGVNRIVPLAGRRVFTPMADGTGIVWDLSSPPAKPTAADEKQLAAWWDDLRADEPAKAYAAVWRLTDAAPESVGPFLAQHLRPEAAPDPAKLQKLIADLDSDTFRIRERAAKDLQDLGHAAAPTLQKALAAKPAPETTRRIEQLLARKPDVGNRPDQLRRLRAMQVLERISTPEARQVLKDLAEGLPLAAETREAKAALGRK
jgi:WD40 repeat protein